MVFALLGWSSHCRGSFVVVVVVVAVVVVVVVVGETLRWSQRVVARTNRHHEDTPTHIRLVKAPISREVVVESCCSSLKNDHMSVW